MSRLENILDDPQPINDSFPDEQLASINVSHNTPWYVDYANYIVAKYIPPSFTYKQKKKFFYDLRHYFLDDPHLYKEGVDGIIRHCVPYVQFYLLHGVLHKHRSDTCVGSVPVHAQVHNV